MSMEYIVTKYFVPVEVFDTKTFVIIDVTLERGIPVYMLKRSPHY